MKEVIFLSPINLFSITTIIIILIMVSMLDYLFIHAYKKSLLI
jgi:hypothetical protein